MDYAYTIQGWLKGINSPDLKESEDLGGDGVDTPADVYGMSLAYYNGDYVSDNAFADSDYQVPGAKDLYNGNISAWSDKIAHTQTGSKYSDQLTGHRYTYDKLNRIKEAEFGTWDGSNWNMQEEGEYNTTYSYDGNGNLKSLKRNAYSESGALLMDSLQYHYTTGTNRLSHVDERAGAGSHDGMMEDITDQEADNYTYDGIGNMTRDESEGITIKWNVQGKVQEVIPDEGVAKPHIRFNYDAGGNRVAKQLNHMPVYTAEGELDRAAADPEQVEITYYVRDASGNMMSIYKRTHEVLTVDEIPVENYYKAIYTLNETPVYGSSRVGQVNSYMPVAEEIFHIDDFDEVHFTTDPLRRITELENRKAAGYQKEVHSSTNGTAYIDRSTVYSYDPASSSFTGGLEFIGSTGNNLVVGEEGESGDLQFTAVTGTYWGHDHTTLLYNTDGKLIKGSENISSDKDGKGVAVAVPGASGEYYYLTTDTTDTLRYYKIDMSQTGYGTAANPEGIVTDSGIVAGVNYGRHLAVIEDYIRGESYIYATRHDPLNHITSLYRILVDKDGIYDPVKQASYMSYDTEGDGELQVTQDGKTLLVYNHKEALGFFSHREAEVLSFTLTAAHGVAEETGGGETRKSWSYEYGNHPKGSLDGGAGSKWFHVNQTALVNFTGPGATSNKQVYREELGESETIADYLVSTGAEGDLRRSGDAVVEMMIADKSEVNNWEEVLFFGGNITTLTSPDTLTGYQPYQPHRIYSKRKEELIATRTIGTKVYELSDHLGNVRAVVSDAKKVTTDGNTITAAEAEVLTYNNYYAFGMQMPGRSFSSPDYRYGFNGMEKDDEIAGSGNSYTAEFWQYDSRLGRRWNVDPVVKEHESSYAAFANNPIWFIDPTGADSLVANPDGDEFWLPDHKDWKSHVSVWFDINKTTEDGAVESFTLYNDNSNAKWSEKQYNAKYEDGNFLGYFDSEGNNYNDLSKYYYELDNLGTRIRTFLDSDFEKRAFENYWKGEGDMELSSARFNDAVSWAESNGKVTSTGSVTLSNGDAGTAKVYSFYSSATYNGMFGSATIYYDASGNAVGLYDYYDFDAKPLWGNGSRSFSAEMKTRMVLGASVFSRAKAYKVFYGVIDESKK